MTEVEFDIWEHKFKIKGFFFCNLCRNFLYSKGDEKMKEDQGHFKSVNSSTPTYANKVEIIEARVNNCP